MRYFIGLLASIGLIILVFVLVLRGFSGGPEVENKDPLSNYASSDAIVRLTVDGRIVSDLEHRAYQITVGRSEVRLETLKGYEYEIIQTKTYENNQESYHNFLRALDIAGFAKGVDDKNNRDERGVCAEGRRYVFEVLKGTSEEQRYWATSCGGEGTFKGNVAAVRALFDNQIPDRDLPKTAGQLEL
jgi:hypothetical protein